MKRAAVILAVVAGLPIAARADDEPASESPKPAAEAETKAAQPEAKATKSATAEDDDKPKRLEISGYLQPALAIVYNGDAVPRDQLRYGAEPTRAGIELSGTPIPKWSYHLEIILAGETNDLVTDVKTVDTNGDGVPDSVAPKTDLVPGIFVERAYLEYAIGSGFSVRAGQYRIPFTVQEQAPSTELMFPTRSGPNEVFVQGPDLGAEAVYHADDDLLIARLGGFNGTGEPVDPMSVHGVVYSARVDVNPLGEFPIDEVAHTKRGPLRIGVGAGMLYFGSRHYDSAGYPGSQQRDFRMSASFRMAVSGFYLQTEVLRRQQTDSLSNRPGITSGAYTQASLYVPASIGVAPIARIGWSAEDQGFAERDTLSLEAGVAVYPEPTKTDAMRLLVEYRSERRLTESEQAHAGVVQAQIVW